MASFLSVFKTILHGLEVAASIAAPIVATQDPIVGALMQQATAAAVAVEQGITTPGQGSAKAQAVKAGTQATVDAINGILTSQGKNPLPQNTTDVVQAQVVATVTGMNAILAAVTGSAHTSAPAPAQ